MMCVKICETVHGKSASYVCSPQNCSVFMDFPVSMAMSSVSTKRFNFKCSRPVEARPPRTYPIVVMVALRNNGCLHLPPVRTRSDMTWKDILYNEFRKYLQDHGAGFPAELASSLGDEFMKHVTYAFFL